MHLAGHHVGEYQAGTAVGNMGDEHARLRFKQFSAEMAVGAVSAGAVVELAGPGLCQGNELGQVFNRQAARHHQHTAGFGHIHHRHKVALDVVWDFRIDDRPNRVRAAGSNEQGVAVRRRLGHMVRADGASSARTVVDDDLLAKFF